MGGVIHTQVKTVSTGFGSAIMKVELIKSKATQKTLGNLTLPKNPTGSSS